MRTLSDTLPMLATAALGLTFCAAGRSDTPAPPCLTIENHQKLVTVKDDKGNWLFAQIIPSPNVRMDVASLGKGSSRLSLLDAASGRVLWSKTLPEDVSDVDVDGAWSADFLAMVQKVLTNLEAETGPIPTPHSHQLNRFGIVLGPDDQLITCQLDIGKDHISATPLKNGLLVREGRKEMIVVLPTPAPSPAAQPAVDVPTR
jgi:hypothetical protein